MGRFSNTGMSNTTATLSFKSRLEKIGVPKSLAGMLRVFAPPGVRLAGAGIQFLSTIIIARQLGDEKSAGFFFWSAILMSLASVATFGLEHLVLRNVPRLHDGGSRKKLESYISSIRSIVLILSGVIGIGLMAYASFRYGGDKEGFQIWHPLLPLALGAIALTLINGETLKGLTRPVAGIFFGHFIPVSMFCALIILNTDKLTVPFLIVIYTFAYVFGVTSIRFVPSKTCHSKMFSLPPAKQSKAILAEGFPVFCTNALGALCYIVPLMLLDFLRPASEVAYVTTSFRISILLAVLATAIHGVFAPQLSRAAGIPGNSLNIFKVYGKATVMTLLALVLPFGIGIAFPDWIMSIFGEQFRAGADTLRILLIFGATSLCVGPMFHLLLMTGNTRILARLGVVKLLLVSALSALLIPSLGGIGMVIAMGTAFFLEEVFGLVYVARQLKRQKTPNPTDP